MDPAFAVFVMVLLVVAGIGYAYAGLKREDRCPECGSDRITQGVRYRVRTCDTCGHEWDEDNQRGYG